MRRKVVSVVCALAGLAVLFVIEQAIETLQTLTRVEAERDTWQRPEDILRHLNLRPGHTVVDLGSGAGYFALKMAPRVAPNGRILAVDLRRESLAFLWIRARRGGHSNLHVIHSRSDDPMLPPVPIDAVLIANTYHELTAPDQIPTTLFASMPSGARLVVVDRAPRGGTQAPVAEHHDITPEAAEVRINQHAFQTVLREDRFIDRPGDDDIWWLIVFRRP